MAMRVRTPENRFVTVPDGTSYKGVNLAAVPRMAAALKKLHRYHSDWCPELLQAFKDFAPADFLQEVLEEVTNSK
jgi:hypothetical protein